MLALTGRRWTWPRRRVVEWYYVPETVATVNLSGRPVSGINSVVDWQGNSYDYTLTDAFRLWFPQLANNGWGFGGFNGFFPFPNYDATGAFYPYGRFRGTRLTIDYVYGNPPPLDVQRAIDEFAVNLDAMGTDACQFPSRTTSVAREGVSFTILDPQQFLVGGKTGLYYPDLVISMYGNGVKMRAKVYSPEHPPPRRLSSQIVDPNADNGGSVIPVGSYQLTSQVNPIVYTTAQTPFPFLLNQYDTAVGGDLAPLIPLAASLPVGSTIGFKKADSATTSHILTPTMSGSDHLNTGSGATTVSMTTTNEIVWLTTDGSSIWTRVDGDLDVYDGGSF